MDQKGATTDILSQFGLFPSLREWRFGSDRLALRWVVVRGVVGGLRARFLMLGQGEDPSLCIGCGAGSVISMHTEEGTSGSPESSDARAECDERLRRALPLLLSVVVQVEFVGVRA